MQESIINLINESVRTFTKISEDQHQVVLIENITNTILNAFNSDNKLLLCGNGGSAADSQHIAAEFTGRFLKERESVPAISLTTNTSVITAIGNDYGYDKVFSRQVSGLLNKKDCLIGISTSGKSQNIILAFEEAKKIGAKTISFTGHDPSPLSLMADFSYNAPSLDTPRIQECHIFLGHFILEKVEDYIISKKKN